MNNLNLQKDETPNSERLIESIMLKKILKLCPEAHIYESKIKFNHVNKKASIDLALLPAELAAKITQMLD